MSQAGVASGDVTPGTEVDTLTGNTGGAVGPNAAFNIFTVGTGSITIAGNPATNTLTTQLTGLTNHSLLVGAGTATITNLGVATNGQLPIGSTGVDPVLATLTQGTNISITNGAGSITIASSAASFLHSYKQISFADSPYTVLATDSYISIDTSGGNVVLNFPNTPVASQYFTIKDRTGNSGANNVTYTTPGGVTLFDNATSGTLNNNHAAKNIGGNGTSYEVF